MLPDTLSDCEMRLLQSVDPAAEDEEESSSKDAEAENDNENDESSSSRTGQKKDNAEFNVRVEKDRSNRCAIAHDNSIA